ncbi:hypothetical protein BC830DRAFT_1053593, partial [Chytriomyces sp. MP71]
ILGEHFGAIVQQVGTTLLAKGRQPMGGLVAASGLSARHVREALFVLMQHGIAAYTEKDEGLRVAVHYSANVLPILLRDRYPLYLRIAKLRFGHYVGTPSCPLIFPLSLTRGHLVVAEVLKHGRCTFATIQNILFPDIDNAPAADLDDLENAFNLLWEQNFITRVGSEDSLSNLDRKLAEEEAEVAKNPHMTANEKIKMKKMLENRNKGGLCQLVENRINSSARELMKTIMDFAEPSMKHCKADEVSAAVTLTQLATRIDPSHFAFHPSNSRSALSDYMSLLTQDSEFPFLAKQDERGGGQYVVNLHELRRAMQEQLVVNYVREKHGIVAARIWRLLRTKGMLGEKEVAKLALVGNKVARETLFALMNTGMIFLQDVPKTVDHAPSRTFFLWFVSLPKCVDALILETYKMMANVKLRRLKEYNANGQLIEKIERSDIQADESLLTDGERQSLENFNKMMEKLRISELRLDQALLILRDY